MPLDFFHITVKEIFPLRIALSIYHKPAGWHIMKEIWQKYGNRFKLFIVQPPTWPTWVTPKSFWYFQGDIYQSKKIKEAWTNKCIKNRKEKWAVSTHNRITSSNNRVALRRLLHDVWDRWRSQLWVKGSWGKKGRWKSCAKVLRQEGTWSS